MMDGFRSNDGLLVIATTNHPENIDPALLNRPSRFDRVWKIDLPTLPCRETSLARLFREHLGEEEVRRLARQTEGFSGAYLKELYISSAQEALREDATGPARIRGEHVARVLPLLKAQIEEASNFFESGRHLGFGAEEPEED